MHILIVYDTVYGSTAQVASWIGERLEGCKDVTATVARISERFDLSDYDAVIIGSPIYRNDQILDTVKEFVLQHKERLSEKKVGIFIVALDTGGAYYRGRTIGGIKDLESFAALFDTPPIYGKVLGGEQVPTRLSDEDRRLLLGFYRKIMGMEIDDVPYRYSMDKEGVWQYAERFYRYASR
ncbi:flavodoxin domain-containing protein [Candidatus Acetothermia bacterium]|jgi:menaquinone-dependent protoporphyrinogen IX oxidase|nr:flavodoxin domain-containing protein [Candidatus Acetothermia bacterium]MCI2426133.1 flavodoxin domain-containing protein [Candidatus Acetothermia bacterium]MCI2427295.1 flavodoxin domain-containing protein [Candidatus Acetothermia bacterium]MCI2428680.1 flavodoxin domain-containing protein [Candidatus Acetothermia bacterium]